MSTEIRYSHNDSMTQPPQNYVLPSLGDQRSSSLTKQRPITNSQREGTSHNPTSYYWQKVWGYLRDTIGSKAPYSANFRLQIQWQYQCQSNWATLNEIRSASLHSRRQTRRLTQRWPLYKHAPCAQPPCTLHYRFYARGGGRSASGDKRPENARHI